MARDTGSPEWVIMYRQGLTPRQIADLCRVRLQQVKRAIVRAVFRDPEAAQEHLRNLPRVPVPSKRWKDRCEALKAFTAAHGRPPFVAGHGPEESSLGRWLEKQRGAAVKGELPEAKRRALDEAGNWMAPPRSHLNILRWDARLEELAKFVAAESRLPSYRYAATDAERVLGNWLHTQRQQLSRGKLSAGQLQSLQETVPEWQTRRAQSARKTAIERA